MSFTHMLILGIIALIVIPPDKLPEFAREVARFINDLKRSTSGIWDDLKEDAMLKPDDLLKIKNITKPSPPPVVTPVSESTGHGPESVAPVAEEIEKKPNE
jgi:Sec-independent protein translocase protein TatA